MININEYVFASQNIKQLKMKALVNIFWKFHSDNIASYQLCMVFFITIDVIRTLEASCNMPDWDWDWYFSVSKAL